MRKDEAGKQRGGLMCGLEVDQRWTMSGVCIVAMGLVSVLSVYRRALPGLTLHHLQVHAHNPQIAEIKQ